MPFSEIKKTNDVIVKGLTIISIIIAGVMIMQVSQDFKAEKEKTSDMRNILKIITEQNIRSIEDRKLLHDENERSFQERKELFDRLKQLEKDKK